MSKIEQEEDCRREPADFGDSDCLDFGPFIKK